jgi:hypothetical protein
MSAEPTPMDYYTARDELNEMREYEARCAWERVKAREVAVARILGLGASALEAIAADHRTLELELGFSPRSRWNG